MPDLRDPETVIADEAHEDHRRARIRGQRIRELTNLVVSALDGHGVVLDSQHVRVIVYGALVDGLYGNLAVDIDPRP
jgi:hypothetical protein